jgi:hypothetical protein
METRHVMTNKITGRNMEPSSCIKRKPSDRDNNRPEITKSILAVNMSYNISRDK